MLAIAGTLAACGGPPSEADVRAAMLRQGEAMGLTTIDAGFKANVEKIKLIGCVKAEPTGYRCDLSNAAGAAGNSRFVKTESGWAIVN